MDPDQTADAQAGLDPCWSQTHYVGFVMMRLICLSMPIQKICEISGQSLVKK
jgi:hypothetical protein